jgi:hypothetical protein
VSSGAFKGVLTIANIVISDSRWKYQLGDHPLASALRTQIEWASFGSELNPFDRYNPWRPLILWHNNRRFGALIRDEIMKRYKELKESSAGVGKSSVARSRSIITLALEDYLKEKDVSVAGHPAKSFSTSPVRSSASSSSPVTTQLAVH